jgi:hypothetical protein
MELCLITRSIFCFCARAACCCDEEDPRSFRSSRESLLRSMDIEAGRLEVVLPRLRLPASSIHAIYPHSRLTAAKVRLCVDFLWASLKRQ